MSTRMKSQYVYVDNTTEIHYIEKGTGNPILWIPGLTFSGESFEAQLNYFSATHRVIAIDPRGQGLSTKTSYGNNYKTPCFRTLPTMFKKYCLF